MVSIDEFEEMLDEIAEQVPWEFYRELNGGILVQPEEKLHPESRQGDLHIMGEYCVSHSLGRYIALYYGSFAAVGACRSRERLARELRKTLLHEFRHHLEGLAGERGLEVEDAIGLERYRRSHEVE